MSLTHAPELDPEFVKGIRTICEEQIVFNKVLGLQLTHLSGDAAQARIDMREDLIGHFQYNRLHGGVVSAVLDTLGGIACMNGLGVRHIEEPVMDRLKRFSKLGTIDLRSITCVLASRLILWLAASWYAGFTCGQYPHGFLAPDGKLLATGCGAYIIS